MEQDELDALMEAAGVDEVAARLEKLLNVASHPLLRLPWLLLEGAMFLAGSAIGGLRLYHEICVEILENFA